MEDKRNPSNIRYYTCDDKGLYSSYCPKNRGPFNKKSNKEIHHAHTTEDDESTKKIAREERVDCSSDDEYVLILALMGTISHGIND